MRPTDGLCSRSAAARLWRFCKSVDSITATSGSRPNQPRPLATDMLNLTTRRRNAERRGEAGFLASEGPQPSHS
jgi:hypothetical protein